MCSFNLSFSASFLWIWDCSRSCTTFTDCEKRLSFKAFAYKRKQNKNVLFNVFLYNIKLHSTWIWSKNLLKSKVQHSHYQWILYKIKGMFPTPLFKTSSYLSSLVKSWICLRWSYKHRNTLIYTKTEIYIYT